jgi:CRISPR-associated exonuclease Cas4
MEDDEILIPLSALEHWHYCPRQCALIHVEGVWAESAHTVEGRQLHERVDLPGMEQRPGLKLARALSLRCDRLNLVGKADLVAFYEDPAYPKCGRPFPVEYKRGGLNRHRSAELQLCAQALCLEEMLGVSIPAGALYFGTSRRRREVAFTRALRAETESAALAVGELLRQNHTPLAQPGPKCQACSLNAQCLPGLPDEHGLDRYFRSLA